MSRTNTLTFGAIALASTALIACSTQPQDPAFQAAKTLPKYDQTSFSDYVADTKQWLETNRVFMTQDKESELLDVLPREYKPQHPNGQGVLLVHGLGDTPYSFINVAEHLAKKGYLVRTVLLSGHASKVGDLQLPSLEDWQGIVDHHARLLKTNVDSIWVGGYSTGANLVTDLAIQDESINGVLLFSPAFQPNSSSVKYAGLASYFVTWADQDPEDNPLRYNSLPMSAAAVYYETSVEVRDQLEDTQYEKPVFMLMSEGDRVIDTQFAIDIFTQQFNNPNSRLIWQGEQALAEPRSTTLSMRLPEQRISNGSHMGLLFAPNNPNYGVQGQSRICSNGQTEEQEAACMNGDVVWFSAWGHREDNKNHARLTYNPYFTESMALLDQVMGSESTKK
jgi:esterase/lipase